MTIVNIQLNIRTTRQYRSLTRFLADEMCLNMNKAFEACILEFVEARMRVDPEFRQKARPFYEACLGVTGK